MNTHNICFRGEIRKYQHFSDEKSALSVAMQCTNVFMYCSKVHDTLTHCVSLYLNVTDVLTAIFTNVL